MKARHMVLPLNRPQYVTVPEALISALAWRLFHVDLSEDPARPLALLYQSSEKPSKTLEKRSTMPVRDKATEFGSLLKTNGFATAAGSELLGEAVAGSVAGIRAEKSGSQPASPLSPGLALMQNMRGLQGTKNPPDLGEILESIFVLGDIGGQAGSSVSGLWIQAAERRIEIDPVIRAIDNSIEDAVYGRRRIRRDDRGASKAEEWRGMFPRTPFEWFRNFWTTLTREEWVDALPARVWVDWATTVLRLGVGLGYLWEAGWYEVLARQILEPSARTWNELLALVPEPLPWRSSRAG
ncbi:MAG TPA: hypothetical protein VJQ60_11895, partial [Arthrobacter sp.]|nr:hypothetical protein [Arthrobacter sp.]